MTKQKILVSAIILVYHDEKFLKKCVSSLRLSAKKAKIKLEIIIVINDLNLKRSNFRFPNGCRLFFNKMNLGFGKSINIVVRKAKGEWLLLVNIDTETESMAITNLIKHIHDNNTAVIAPKILNKDGTIQLTINNEISIRHLLEEQTYIHKIFPKFFNSPQANVEIYHSPHEVKYIFAAYLLIRKNIFHAVGGFDERYFIFLEDIDLCRKINNLNLKIIYEPEALITHYAHQSNKGINNGKLYLESMKIYLQKWHSPCTRTLALIIIFIGSALRFIIWRLIEIFSRSESGKKEAVNFSNFYKDIISAM